VLVAKRRIFFEGFVDDARELGRKSGIEPDGSDRRMIEDAIENFSRAVAAKCGAASRHLIENNTEAEEIAASVKLTAACLFGRHVGDGAESSSGAGEMGFIDCVVVVLRAAGGCFARDGRFAGKGLSETKIENFCLSTRSDEEVGRLDVAMNDALQVSGVKRVSSLNSEGQSFVERKRLTGDGVLEGLAVQKFHDDERMAVFFADFINGADVRVIESGGGLRFALETFE